MFLRSLAACTLICCVGCSASQAPGSQANGSPGAANQPGGNNSGTGSPDINTTSSAVPDGGNGCSSTLDVTYRDFSEAHPDFEAPFQGDVVRRGLVQDGLGPDLKPIFKDRVGYPGKLSSPLAIDPDWRPTPAVIQSADTFKQWYSTTAGVNQEFSKKLKLEESPAGSGVYGFESSAFFPLSPSEGFGITPKNNDLRMNFLFTTEIHVLFTYTPAQKFTFRGDDDLWIFVNGKLALDLGSLHGPESGTIDFDAQASALGISVGGAYAMDVFHAERHTRGSNFKITTNIACFTPGLVK